MEAVDGFVTLVGRFKEIINRGGEKISPIEIEHVLRRHPAVTDMLVFGAPHAHLCAHAGSPPLSHAPLGVILAHRKCVAPPTTAPHTFPSLCAAARCRLMRSCDSVLCTSTALHSVEGR